MTEVGAVGVQGARFLDGREVVVSGACLLDARVMMVLIQRNVSLNDLKEITEELRDMEVVPSGSIAPRWRLPRTEAAMI